MSVKNYRIARIPGDGIGPEVVREASKVVEAAGERHCFRVAWEDYPFAAEHWLLTGES